MRGSKNSKGRNGQGDNDDLEEDLLDENPYIVDES